MRELEAIILAKKPYREADETLVCLSPQEGVVHVRARGVRKSGAKLAGALRTLNHVSLYVVDGRFLPIVTDVVLKENFPSVRNEAEKAYAASAVAAFCADILPEGAHDMVSWWQLTDLLYTLAQHPVEPDTVRYIPTFFIYTLMRLSGLMPEMRQCVLCGYAITAKDTCRFSAQEGGVLHSTCRTRRPFRHEDDSRGVRISPAARAQLRTWNTLDTRSFLSTDTPPETLQELETLVNQFVQWHLGASMYNGARSGYDV